MVTENQGGDQTPQPDERNLVIRSEQTSLQQMAENPVLAIFGFSPEFPAKLARLNEVLGRIDLPARTLDITLYPGQTPIIQTYLEPYRGSFVNVRAYRDDQVELTIEHPHESTPVGQGFQLLDIQDFLRSTFPNREARLFVSRNLWKSDIAADEDVDQDLQLLNEEALKPITRRIIGPNKKIKGRAYEFSGEIRLAGQKDPLMVVRFWDRSRYDARDEEDRTVIIHAQKFFYNGSANEIERVMEEATKFFDKPDMYPYRWEDRYPEDQEK